MRAPRRTPEEWQTILDRFKASGLSQAAFCEQEEIKVCTLRYWLYRPDKMDSQFVPIRVSSQTPTMMDDSQYSISIRVSGIRIEIGVRDCARVLRTLGG